MLAGSKIKILIPIGILLLILFITGAIGRAYLRRTPVLIVTDSSFSLLYGNQRLKKRLEKMSRELFRPVIPVLVDESAGPDLIALAVEGTREMPWAVVFPFRYFEGARLYKEANGEVPVLVIGVNSERKSESLSLIRTDTALDIYRAGACAALLCGEKKPLFFSDGTLQDEYRELFREGFEAQGGVEEPVFVNAASSYSSYEEIGCVIVAGPASRFFEQNLDIPTLLFSWADPEFTPKTVKLIFDDSHWALAVEALKSLPGEGEEILIPSSMNIFKDRFEEKGDFQKLRSALKMKFK